LIYSAYTPLTDTNNTPIADNIQCDKLKLLYNQSVQAVFFSVATAFLYAVIIWPQVNHQHIIIWLCIVFVTSSFRLFLFQNYKRSDPQGSDVLKWERPYLITLIISSLTWGIGTVLLTHNQPLLYQLISYFILIGMAGAALGVYSSIRYIAITTIVSVLLPATLWLFIQGTQTTVLIALASSLFFASAIRGTKILAHTLHQTFQLSNELTIARDTAERLARTDMLTGLNNRRAFTDLCNQRLAYCQRHQHPVSLLLLDLDYFKKINDQFGHDAGDSSLQQLAEILSETVRSSDICGRIGGEEFALLLSNTEMAEASLVAEKLKLTIEHSVIKTAEAQFSITASIGVASCHDSLEALLKAADNAMYKAKHSGRNCVICDESKPAQRVTRLHH